MKVWTIADLHLSFGVPGKKMDVFGERWFNHEERLKEHWLELIAPEDLVLIPGDISWAMHFDQAIPDLEWIDRLPGTKLLLRGNHDYWWSAITKIRKKLPPTIHLIHNDSMRVGDLEIGGARLWDNIDLDFDDYVVMNENPFENKEQAELFSHDEENEKILHRELLRLETSLKTFKEKDTLKIAMTHYPPVGPEMEETAASRLFKKYGVKIVVFGHLHNVTLDSLHYGEKEGIRYIYSAGDYIDFRPIRVL